MEKTFVDELAKTGDPTYAAWKAGSSNPVVIGQRMAAKPELKEAGIDAARRMLAEEGTLVAVGTLIEISGNEKYPANSRVSASDKILKYSGFASAEGTEKDLAAMSGEELAREIARSRARGAALEHVAAERSRPVIEGELAGEAEAEEGAGVGVMG